MRSSTVIMIGLALLFGALAVLLSNSWLESQNARLHDNRPIVAETPKRTIVVAASPLRFGAELSSKNLREIPWGAENIPSGSFQTVAAMLEKGRRIALTSIEPDEPVLSFKITGPGERATLSAVIEEGRRAVTVRVDDVFGVAGFILPGDRVDVILTQQGDNKQNTSDLLIQGVRVLAVDQIADDRAEKPFVAKAVTLEVDSTGAQKIALATTLGTLSLMLRPAGEMASQMPRRVNVADLLSGSPSGEANSSGLVTVTVTRASNRTEYSVPVEGLH